jgi:hypothetical protein
VESAGENIVRRATYPYNQGWIRVERSAGKIGWVPYERIVRLWID